MAILTIEVLRQIIQSISDAYTIEYQHKNTIAPIEDRIEVDISNQRLIFK